MKKERYAVIVLVGYFSSYRGKQYRKVTADMLQCRGEAEYLCLD